MVVAHARRREIGHRTLLPHDVSNGGLVADDEVERRGVARFLLSEGNGPRLTLLQYAGVPIALLVGGRGVRDVADIGEGYSSPRFDPSPGRQICIFDVVGADIDLVGTRDDRSGRAGNLGRRWRRP